MGEGIAALARRTACTDPGVEILGFFGASSSGIRGAFSLSCSDGSTVFLGAIFFTTMDLFIDFNGAILSTFTAAAGGGGEVSRPERLLCGLHSPSTGGGVPPFIVI